MKKTPLALLLGLLGGSASAQNAAPANQPLQLEPIQVSTSALRTTTGLALSPKDTPQSVSNIDGRQLQERGITTLKDALKTTTGVNVVPDSTRTRFQTRGFYIDQIEEDGLASTVPGASGNPYRDAQSLSDLAIYDHIEVVRGATGLTQANGEPGGTINAVRKRPTAETKASIEGSVNSFGRQRAVFDASGSLSKGQDLRGRVIGVLGKDSTFKERGKGEHYTLYGVMEKDFGPDTTARLGGLVQNERSTPDPFGLPMAEGGRDAHFPRKRYLGFNWNRSDFEKFNAFGEIEHRFHPDWQWQTKFGFSKEGSFSHFGALANSSTSYGGLKAGDKLTLNNINRYDNWGQQFQVQTGVTGKYQALGRDHDLFAHYSFSHERGRTRWRRQRNDTAFDPYSFRGDELARPNWSQFDDRTRYASQRKSHAISLGTRFNALDNFHILAGGRYTHWQGKNLVDYDWWDGKPDPDTDSLSRQKRSRFVPYLGLSYDIDAHNTVYAHHSRIFKPQGSRDLQGNFLPPLLGSNSEIGWKGEWLDGDLNASVALFQVEQRNRPIAMTDAAMKKNYAIASGKVRSRGVDVEVSGKVNEDWQVFAGYTYNRSKYLRTESDRYPAGMNFSRHTPRHLFRLYSSYRLPSRWTVGAGVDFQSRVSSLWGVSQGSYALVNANANYQVNDHFNVGISLNNLTNKRYFENHRVRTNGINNFIGEPRNVMVNFRWDL